MKKSLKKVIGTVAAFTALTAVMAVSANAETVAPGQGINFTATATKAGEQVTILVLKPDADVTDGISETEIAYIDQNEAVALADGTFGYEFTMPVDTKDGEKYAVLTGAETKTEASQGEVEVKDDKAAVHYGDVTGDSKITGADALSVMYYVAEDYDNAGEGFDEGKFPAAADTTGDNKVTGADALQILYFVAEDIDNVKFDYSWTGYEA